MGLLLIGTGLALRGSQDRAVRVAIAGTETALAPTATATLTPTASPTPGPSPTPTLTPTGTIPASATPGPTPVPPMSIRVDTGSYPTPSTPPSTQIPPPVEPVDIPDGVVNVMLLGSDKRADDPGFRTDTIIVVSINTIENSVNMLSIPRDIMVYVPGWTMAKINTAYQRGESTGWRGGGAGLLKETLLYNFGIRVDYYALVDISSFQDIVNTLDGVEVPVDCALTGYVLREPRKSIRDFATYEEWTAYTADEDNWMEYTLPVGVHQLDGYEALWYARYRYGSSDFDRAFRQQQVLRAILTRARTLGLVDAGKIPGLWQQYSDLVQTDMGLGNMLQFGPVAANIDDIAINTYVVTPDLLTAWYDLAIEQQVFLLNPEGVASLMQAAMNPPAQNYLIRNTASVEVRNGTVTDRLDEVAADRIERLGLRTTATGAADSTRYRTTVIYDFTGREKTSQLSALQRSLRVADADVIIQPDPNRTVDYVVILGQNYTSCTRSINVPDAPRPTDGPGTGTPSPDSTVTPDAGLLPELPPTLPVETPAAALPENPPAPTP
ncbi:MAG: LCP family protein [Anaerolineae bacterium]|nr:LCP family protein [Anaerolineae bacterium]